MISGAARGLWVAVAVAVAWTAGAARAAPLAPAVAAPGLHLFSPAEPGRSRSSYVAHGQKAMIATAHPLATAAGLKMLKAGGNAYDAAVAASFVISVVRPQATGLGGGGFLLGYVAAEKRTHVYDFRERAPAAATRDMFLDAKGEPVPGLSEDGPLAAGIPGVVKGLLEVHAKHGKLPLKDVLEPAIEAAANGFPVYPGLAKEMEERAPILARYPASAKIFLKNGKPYKLGEKLVQTDLAATLRLIRDGGAKVFYEGKIARLIAAEMQRDKGILTAKDLAGYQVKEREPVTGTYRGYRIVSMPPPSSGGAHIIEIMNILAGDDYGALGFGTVKSVHLLAEAMRRAFADRAEFLGDPDVIKVPLKGLTSPAYGAAWRKTIDLTKATPSASLKKGTPQAYESPSTTHLSVMDADGNAVSTTQTVNLGFGSCVVAAGTGVLMNDEMDDFAKKAGAPNGFGLLGNDANAVAPGKTPLSSMSPTLVFAPDGHLALVVGSPGGPRIISATLQTILNVIDFKMDLPDAVHANRIHHQWMPDVLKIEPNGLDPAVEAELTRMGHKVVPMSQIGDVQAIAVSAKGLTGVSDTRSEGQPAGL